MSTNHSHVLILQARNAGHIPQVQYTRGLDLSGTIEGAGGIGGLLMRSHGYSGGNWSTHNAYHSDANGNVTALMNSSGVLQASYKYNPYGGFEGCRIYYWSSQYPQTRKHSLERPSIS